MGQTRPLSLRYTTPALSDLAAVLDYISAHSPRGAQNVQRRLQTVIALLIEHPKIGSKTDDPIIRRVATPPYPYFIYYEATESEIVIHGVRHAARDPANAPRRAGD